MEAVTTADLLEALRVALEARPGPADALTTGEWAELMGLRDPKAMRAKLKPLLATGKMVRVVVRRTDMKGVEQPVPGYRLAS